METRFPGQGPDQKTKVDSDDTTSNYLINKLTGDGITFTKQNPGSNETLKAAIDISSPGARILQIDPGAMLTTGTSSKVVANGYAGLEFGANQTNFAVTSIYWRRGPTTAVTIKVKFIIKQNGTGSYVRVAAKVKARATGEDSSTAFDASSFTAVPITFATIGQVFEGVISLTPAIFADNDAVALDIGRDGANTLGAGNNDNCSKPIQIIAIEMEVN